MTAQDSLRKELLRDALGDYLPMGHLTSIIAYDKLAKTVPAQQELALLTIRSLLEDGLMEVGDLTGEYGELVSWNLSLDETMARVYDRFVTHYDDPSMWQFNFWLGLTDKGKGIARMLKAQGAD